MSGETVINVEQFLKDAKITEIAAVFKNREISIEELIEYDSHDLESFATDVLKLDALQKNRFIKAISKHKSTQTIDTFATTGYKSNFHVIVSASEHNAITKLYEKYDKASSLTALLHNATLSLNHTETMIIKQIENIFDSLMDKLESKKQYLLNDIDNQLQNKQQLFNQQLSSLQNYLTVIENGKTKYKQHTSNNNMNIKQRKTIVLKLIDDILNYDNISMAMITAPKMQYNANQTHNKFNKLFTNTFKINDCDQPKIMKLSKRKIGSSYITVEYKLHQDDINGAKKILQIQLEYVILPKSYSRKKGYVKRKKKKKKFDDIDRSDNSESDSESQSNSCSNSIVSDTDDDVKIDDIDTNCVKWKTIEKNLKYKKYKSINKYKISDLKANRGYMIRIRARNSSGWGLYSNIVSVITKMERLDKWDQKYVGNGISFKGNILEYSGSSSTSAFLSKIVSKGIHIWTFKVYRCNNNWCLIGVCKETGYHNANTYFTSGGSTPSAYGIGTGKLAKNSGHGAQYGKKCGNGDIVEMKLDFKTLSVSYKVNGIKYGVAFSIENVKYRAAICCQKTGDKLEIKKYERK